MRRMPSRSRGGSESEPRFDCQVIESGRPLIGQIGIGGANTAGIAAFIGGAEPSDCRSGRRKEESGIGQSPPSSNPLML
jgi:hypothetical protein